MHINVTAPTGQTQRLEALEGFRVMEIIRDWAEESGIGIKAECGGACACATCHVYVDEAGHLSLPDMRDDEEDRLDDAHDVRITSRLSCQLIMSEELDGLNVTVADDAYVDIPSKRVAA